MTAKGPKSLGELLGGGQGALARLAREADRRVELGEHLRAGLAPELRDAVVACNLRDDGTVVVMAASPAWAARLRYEGENLLAHCRQRFPAVTRLRVRTGV